MCENQPDSEGKEKPCLVSAETDLGESLGLSS